MAHSPDSSQLPFLLRLVDDTSPQVRERVAHQLRAFGDRLKTEIERQNLVVTASQRVALDKLGLPAKAVAPSQSWLEWMRQRDENAKLEAALSHLSQWQIGAEAHIEYSNEASLGSSRSLDLMPPTWEKSKSELNVALDRLAQDFRATGRPWHPESLSAWLFVEKSLRGNTRDYYNARNSNLLHVIQYGRGIPISLSCIFILVGARLGLDIRGCNFPGHFLAHARSGGLDLLFDCFDAGRLLTPFETNAIRKAEPRLLSARMASEIIVARILRNLAVAYEHAGETENVRYIQSLLSQLEHATGR